MRSVCVGFAATFVAALVAVHDPSPAQAALSRQELKCSATLAKNYSKLQFSLLKLYSRCHTDDISGKNDSADGCATLTGKSLEKANKARDKFVAKIAKACHSVCSSSNDVECVTDLTCPAKHIANPPANPTAETCAGKGGSSPFTLNRLNWPGPYCDAILGHAMTKPEHLGECVAAMVDSTVAPLDRAVFADLNEGSGLDKDALKCVSKVAKSVGKAATKAYLAAASCRDEREALTDTPNEVPTYDCTINDADTIDDIDKWLGKLTDAVAKACSDTSISALAGLCADGGVVPANVADAQACLSDLVREIATEERGYNRHVYGPVGMLNLTHPASAEGYCGDGLVTPKREEHTGVGEECDGDDTPCGGGSCIPPGDLFECTCDSTPRERFVVNGDTPGTDSDAGWLGSSHDATHNNGFGYVLELSNCSCDEFTQATCTTPSGDNVCDVYGNMAPRCSDDLNGTQTCDQRGNNDGNPTNSDCFRCNDDAINAGDYCGNGSNANENACQSRCFVDATDLPVTPDKPCLNQGECSDGETCRGRCDNSITCNEMTEGSPLPLISAANPVCIMLKYKTDITGTKNIVTGETAIHYTTRSLVSLGQIFAEPCPVCGGVCIGGSADQQACFGTCDVSGDPCLFDSDCTGGGDTVCEQSDTNCPGGFCSLDLRCSSGQNQGKLCRPDTTTPLGTVSHDCPPTPNETISGTGVTQPFGTVTTEAVEFPVGGPCTDPAWANFDCPCPADTPPNTGLPTGPSTCAAACDGGANAGKGCVTGAGGAGVYTVCTGGTEAGKACDADSDCDGGGLCNGNPRECSAGDVAKLGTACAANGDCGGGGLCADPCPGARCVPLCLREGKCNGGARDGDPCSTLDHCKQCTAGNPSLIGTGCDTNARCNTTSLSGDGVCETIGGVTCDITDPEDGMCAAGPQKFRCTGTGYTTIPCTLEYGLCSSTSMGPKCSKGSPSKRNLACTVNSDCVDIPNVPVSSGCETGIDSLPGTVDDIPGAGECEPRPEDCYVNNGFAEGGDTLNGQGSPSDVKVNAAFCTPANSNSGVNAASGFGGPSRIRREGAAFVNVPAIP